MSRPIKVSNVLQPSSKKNHGLFYSGKLLTKVTSCKSKSFETFSPKILAAALLSAATAAYPRYDPYAPTQAAKVMLFTFIDGSD